LIAEMEGSDAELARRVQQALGRKDLPGRLRLLNDEVRAVAGSRYFMVLSAFDIDEQKGTARYLSMGGLPGLYLRPDGDSGAIVAPGNPLGSSQFRIGSRERTLVPGERLLLYTDGLNELVSAKDVEFGNRRVIDLLKATAGMTLEEAEQSLVTELDKWRRGADQEDDITFVLVEWLG
jgi:phosphoserine phosphatase RsbU/P